MIKNCNECGKEFKTSLARTLAGRGKFCSIECYRQDWKKRIPGWNKGKSATWAIGNTYRNGKPNPNPHKMFGINNPKYISDRTKLKGHNSEERRSSAYITWRRQVLIRDNFKCKLFNEECAGRNEVHHIESFTKFPNLRYEISNGITLCKHHHPRKREDEKKFIPVFKLLIN